MHLPQKKGKGSVESGIKFLQSFSKIYIHPDCKNAQKELYNYCFKKNFNGEILPVPEGENNHLIDALRYSLENVIGENKISAIRGIRI